MNRALRLPSQPGPALNRAIVSLAFPAVAENLLLTTATFTDTLMIGWLHNPAALSALAIGGFINFVLSNLFASVAVASTSLVARAWGADDPSFGREILGQALVFSFLSALVFLLAGYPLADSLMRLMGLQGEAVSLGAYYLQALLVGNLLFFPGIVLFGGMRGSGNTRTPMKVTGLITLLHVFLAYPLIFGAWGFPALGVRGAALAILTTNAGGGLIVILLTWRGQGDFFLRVRHLLPRRRLIRQIIRLAGPAFWEQLIFRTAQLVFMRLVSALGEIALAAHQIANSIESVSYMPGWGFGVAGTTLSGQYMGAGQSVMAERSTWRTMYFSLAVLGTFGLLFLLFGRQLASLFGSTPEVIALAGIAIQLGGLEQPGLAVFNVLGGALRGAGDTRSPMLATLAGVLGARILLVYLFAFVFGWGLAGVWLATSIDWTIRAVFLILFYRQGRWKRNIALPA
ncbi:MAG: MATE family efflux transporter [Coprothermobacterota bacterium]|nr:MATE family efflux transporter [Coprothermobacterota bacterium]